MGVKNTEIFDRMHAVLGSGKDKELAKHLGVSPQAVSNARGKGEIPSDMILVFAEKNKLSVDWLIQGKGPMRLDQSLVDTSPSLTTTKEPVTEYGDPIAQAFLKDWLNLSDVVKMRVWTLVKEELEKQNIK